VAKPPPPSGRQVGGQGFLKFCKSIYTDFNK